MKPDAYMPFYFRAFFEAIESLPETIGLGYLRAICHYWGHNNCRGLENNDEALRRICRIDRAEWVEYGPIIFGRFFELDGGLWHQHRASRLWEDTKKKYDAASVGGKNRWKGVSKVERSRLARQAASYPRKRLADLANSKLPSLNSERISKHPTKPTARQSESD